MVKNQFSVFQDLMKAVSNKIHIIDCIWSRNRKEGAPTTKWYDVITENQARNIIMRLPESEKYPWKYCGTCMSHRSR